MRKHVHLAERAWSAAGSISEGAGAMLSSGWDHCPGPAALGKKGSAHGRGWAGRSSAMAALVKYHVELSSSPSETVAGIAQCLAADPVVSEEHTGGCSLSALSQRQAEHAVRPWPAL